MTLTYDILGKRIELPNGNDDGNEFLGTFDYETEVTFGDVAEFVYSNSTKSLEGLACFSYREAIKDAIDVGAIDLDALEKNPDFIDFMKERYDEKAHKAQEENLHD